MAWLTPQMLVAFIAGVCTGVFLSMLAAIAVQEWHDRKGRW